MSEVAQIILPEGFKRVEYLQSDRNQYIKIDLFDDGDKQLNNKGVWITWAATSYYKYQNIFACLDSDGSVFMAPHWNGDSNSILCGFVSRTNGVYRLNNFNLELGKKYESKLNYLNDGKTFINDDLIANINKNLSYTSDKFIVHLFGCNKDENHSIGDSSVCKINRARITSGETITHDLIACLDVDGRPCMYDLITNKPFYNDGIGEFSYDYSLPKGFKRVEYLQANGPQWIDTGYVPSNNTGMYVKAQQNIHTNSHVMGSGIDTNSPADGFTVPRLLKSTDNTCGFGWGGWTIWGNFGNGDVFESQLNYLNDKKAILRIGKNGDNTYSSNLGELPFTPVKPIYMFTTNKDNEPYLTWNGKIFEAKITEGLEIVKHYIPCLDVDNVPCMYDILGTGTIEENTYYNQGDGQFYYPRDYPSSNYNLPAGFKKCVYLQSDGTQWIDTGVIPDNETGFYFKALQLSYGNCVPFGVSNSSGNDGIILPRFSNKELQYRWGGTNVKMMTWDKAGDLIFHSSLNLYDSKLAKFDSEDTDVETSITSQTGTYTIPVWLFSYNFNGSYSEAYGKWGGRIYRAQITQGDDLIHDYVPCLDVDNRPCMYDLIEQEALYNQSGGTEFTYCVERQLPSDFIKLKYLESTGTQYIKTGYVPTNTTGLYIDALKVGNNDGVPMGIRNANNTDTCIAVGNLTQSDCRFHWNKYVGVGGSGKFRFESSLNWLNDKKSIIKTPIATNKINTLSNLTFTPIQDFHIFGWNLAGTNNVNWDGRIYRAKISEGTEIVRDFVPAFDQRISKPCMYDIINNKVYYNDGTDEFLSNKDYEGNYRGCGVLGGIGNRLGSIMQFDVPEGYTKAAFIQANGNQYIKTGVSGNETSEIRCTFERTTAENKAVYSGATSGVVANLISMFVWGSSISHLRYDWNTTQRTIRDVYPGGMVTTIQTVNGVTLNGKQITTPYIGGEFESPNILLFSFSANNSSWIPSGVRMERWSIKTNGEQIRDMVAAIDSDGKPCMFDMVTQQPYYNSGTGDFTVGLKSLYHAIHLRLPKKSGTLTLSLPINDKIDYYEELIKANNPDWTFTFQYH